MRWRSDEAVHIGKRISILLRTMILIVFLIPISVFGAKEDITFPAKFIRVNSASEINDDDILLIGAFSNDGNFWLMSSEMQGTDWLMASESKFTDLQTCEDNTCCWQLKRQQDSSFKIYSVAMDEYIFVKDNEKVPLNLHKDKGTKWTLNFTSSGCCSLQNCTIEKRFLSLATDATIRFGNYTVFGADNDVNLYLFRLAKTLIDIPGEAILPDDAARVSLLAGEFLSGKDLKKNKLNDFLLCDGRVADDENLGTWTCRYVSADGDRFELERDGKYLDYSLQNGNKHVQWQIRNGYISTTEEQPRHLVYMNGFSLHASDETINAENVVFMPVSAKPNVDFDAERRCKSLRGGWSARRLASLDWEDVLSLDLTGISLPVNSLPFSARPDDANTVVYVKAGETDFVPESWDLVVGCDDEKAVLLRPAELKDKQAFDLMRPVTVEEGTLTYEREAFADGTWETLYVPFDADIPQGFVVEAFEGLARPSGELRFAAIGHIPANTPLIIRYTGRAETGKVGFRIENRSGTVGMQDLENSIFVGTYVPKAVETDGAGVYLLDGKDFVQGAVGSTLQPFRAYMRPDVQSGRLSISHPTTDISLSVDTGYARNVPCYTIDGRKVCDDLRLSMLHSLPHGIYIVGDRKIMK